jgi:CRISPR-associated exonuclease Cas4
VYSEDDLLPISALQHLAFCERQWALIHLEQIWEENRLTAEGKLNHRVVDRPDVESRPGVRVVHAMRLQSLRLGLSGIADVVEMQAAGDGEPGVAIDGSAGRWRPYPVEYKRGRPKRNDVDLVQLAAQVLCLEEMLGVPIPEAAFFYAQPRRRTVVAIDRALRLRTEELATRLHQLNYERRTPPPVYEKKCESCSLMGKCMPRASNKASAYLDRALEEMR